MGKRGSGTPPGAATRLKLTAPVIPEDTLHRSVAKLLDIALLKPAFWTTFPAGGYVLNKASGGRLRAYGLKEGVPDIEVIHDRRAIWLELKRENGVVSPAQMRTHTDLEQAGTPVYICRSPEAVLDALVREMFPVQLSIVKQLLSRDYQPAERLLTGKRHGKSNLGTEARSAAQPTARASA